MAVSKTEDLGSNPSSFTEREGTGEVAEWLKATACTVVRETSRGFESHPLHCESRSYIEVDGVRWRTPPPLMGSTLDRGGFMSEKTRPCEICGQPIHPERLEAVPATTLCIEHAKMIGKYGGEFIVKGVQTNLGKAGSLKKNYGDVSIRKKRNTEGLRKLQEEYEQTRGEETESAG
jgi:hypothetical protein